MNTIDKPSRTENALNDILVFRSCAAVGLIVSDRVSLEGKDPEFNGAFLTPAEARKVADDLNRCADLAENEPVMSREQAAAWLAEHFPNRGENR